MVTQLHGGAFTLRPIMRNPAQENSFLKHTEHFAKILASGERPPFPNIRRKLKDLAEWALKASVQARIAAQADEQLGAQELFLSDVSWSWLMEVWGSLGALRRLLVSHESLKVLRTSARASGAVCQLRFAFSGEGSAVTGGIGGV